MSALLLNRARIRISLRLRSKQVFQKAASQSIRMNHTQLSRCILQPKDTGNGEPVRPATAAQTGPIPPDMYQDTAVFAPKTIGQFGFGQ